MGEGWPTLADVYREVTATRREVGRLCGRVNALAERVERHEADDRRELDELHETARRLSGRERWLTGGLAVVMAVVTLIGAPVVVHVVTGG